MLKEEVVQAVADARFHIYPVTRIEEAMEILTGFPAGERGKDNGYPEGTLFRAVDDRVKELAELARQWRMNQAG